MKNPPVEESHPDETVENICIACREAIAKHAKVCHHCGTRQSFAGRTSVKAITTIGVLATVLSLVTAGVALFPQALAVLFPRAEVTLYRAVKTRLGPSDRDVLEVGFANTGNTDIYIAKLVLRPTDLRLSDENPTSFSIGKSLPAGGVLEETITLRNLRKSALTTVSMDTFESRRDDLIATGHYRKGCYFIEPNNFDEGRSPPIPAFRIANAIVPVEAYIVFGASGNRGVPQELLVSNEMTGTLLFWMTCEQKPPPTDRFPSSGE